MRLRIALSGLLLLCASSCTNTGDVLDGGLPAEPDKSGTRLKVVSHRWTGEDGSRVTTPVNRFFDIKLGVECSFTLAEDGETRCLPVPINMVNGQRDLTTTYFADAACTQPLHNLEKCRPSPQYTFDATSPPAACGDYVPKMYKLGALVIPTTVYRIAIPATPCKALTAAELTALLASQNLYPVTYVAPTDFVKGEAKSVIAP